MSNGIQESVFSHWYILEFVIKKKKNQENKQQPKNPTKFDKNSCITNGHVYFCLT